MLERIEENLKNLTQIPGLSGHEGKVAAYMSSRFKALNFPVKTDVFGNCIAKVEGMQTGGPVTMIFAHMDSLGFLVRKIEEDGFLRVERLGGIPEKVLPSTQVLVETKNGGTLEGVFGVKDHHVTPPEEKYVVDRYMSLFIDIGAGSREEAESLGAFVGSPVVYKPKFVRLNGTRFCASAIDNRGGCATLLELANLMSEEKPYSTVYLVGTVQEEYNLRGAMIAARSVHPDIAVCVDIIGATDTPDLKSRGDVACGHGPVMSMYNFHGRGTLNGTIPHPAIVRLFEQAAKDRGIAFQRLASIGWLTDNAYLQLEGKGVMSIDLGFPGRYAHSPCEVADMKDIDGLSRWILAFSRLIDSRTNFDR